jgi:alkylation response protein AidB-like acyl-CoA dehydrogenase
MTHETKMWGDELYFGLGYDFDPQWYLNDRQKALQARLIEVCQKVIRPEAIRCDETGKFPWKSIEALAELELLGCIVPEKWGGKGENHVGLAMIGETITRYGCASTGVIYMMHMAGLAALLFRASGNEEILGLLRRIDSDVMLGSASFTDPETGGHFWYPKISNVKKVEGGWQVKKNASFTTSCGNAKWVVAQTTSPDFDGDYSNIADFLVYADEMTGNPGLWDVMGMRATVSGPVEIDTVLPDNRLIGGPGDGAASNDEAVNAVAMILYGALYSGIAMGSLDVARRFTTRRRHAQYGQSIADYPTTHDVYGRCLADTQASRLMLYALCQELDRATNDGDWTIYESDPDARPRTPYICWGIALKEKSCRVASEVADSMFHLFGGAAYSRRNEIERFLRDSKAGWIMGPTNEIARGIVGRWGLHGYQAVDWWNQQVNEGLLNTELQKLDDAGKRAIIERLNADLDGTD